MNIFKKYSVFLILLLCAASFASNPLWNRGEFLDDKVYDCGDNADGLEIGDIDNDGYNELIVGNRGTEDFSIFKRIPGVYDSLAPYYTHKLKYAMGVICVADINGDDLNDVILAHYTDYTSGTPKSLTQASLTVVESDPPLSKNQVNTSEESTTSTSIFAQVK